MHILNLLTRISCQYIHIIIVVKDTWHLQANKWVAFTEQRSWPYLFNLVTLAPKILVEY